MSLWKDLFGFELFEEWEQEDARDSQPCYQHPDALIDPLTIPPEEWS